MNSKVSQFNYIILFFVVVIYFVRAIFGGFAEDLATRPSIYGEIDPEIFDTSQLDLTKCICMPYHECDPGL